jgi:multicomponent Na+:H+ antiporter subunit D
MNLPLLLPISIPLLTAISALLIRRLRAQRAISVAGAAALLGAGVALLADVAANGIQTMQMGNWPAPYGITLVADLFSAIMVVLAGLIGLAVMVYSLADIDARRERYGYYSLFHILLMGVCGAFLTGDLFNLYVWFEVLLIASFVLLALGGERLQMEGAIKYVTINLIASTLFLAAVSILYSAAGTLNMADLARKLPGLTPRGLVTAVALLFMVAFGIKAAFFPLFFWLPASYHTPPVAVSALFAGLLTKVGVYALIRTFTLIFVQDTGYTHTIILIAAGLTMIVGALCALAQGELRRILSFLIVSHIGFAVMGLGLFTPVGLAGTVFYIIEDIIVLTALFMVTGVIRRRGGSERLASLGGLYAAAPGLAALFFVPALSLSGIPPLSGFFAKLALLRAGLAAGQYAIVATALIASFLTLMSVARIWSEVFWKDPPEDVAPVVTPRGALASPLIARSPIAVLAALLVAIGLAAGPVFDLATNAAGQLSEPARYVQIVLGGTP